MEGINREFRSSTNNEDLKVWAKYLDTRKTALDALIKAEDWYDLKIVPIYSRYSVISKAALDALIKAEKWNALVTVAKRSRSSDASKAALDALLKAERWDLLKAAMIKLSILKLEHKK